jgi:ABC-type uncharacterized transport system permease subunit
VLVEQLLALFSLDFFHATIRMATPLILAAIGEVYLERSGVINIGMEGLMLFVAFFGVLGASVTQYAGIGLLWSILSGGLAAMVFGLAVITLRANQIVAGAALNIIALGVTTFLPRVIFGIRPLPPQVPGIQDWVIPVLSDIPIIGYILFQQSPIVYLTLVLIIVLTFVLFRTTWGLKIRAVGENPRASDTAGISVYGWRYACVLLNGFLCGVAGATLSLAQLNTFVDNMTAGRGFIALAAVIFGRWNPVGATVASLAFGAANALQLRLQTFDIGISSQLLLMIPYALTLLGVIIFRGQTAAPAALAKPYAKEES